MNPDPPAKAPEPRAPLPPLPRLADALRRLPPSCGPVRLVAVDGHAAGSYTHLTPPTNTELSIPLVPTTLNTTQ
ncbi:hypothetical protein RMO59_34305, partial [Streptomyces alfalfae]